MRRSAALALVLLAAGCGSDAAKHALKPKVPAPIQPARIRVRISAPTHHPRVNAPWPVTIRATNWYGQAVRATLTMRILFNGTSVGKVDNGRLYHFLGSWREKPGQQITWPKASRGQRLQFEAIVTAQRTTVRRTWAITVR